MIDINAIKSLASDIHVLYVEDETELRNTTAKYFRKIFFHVDVAEDGQDGLKNFQENKYDIVITDINMPYMNGIEMIAEIKTLDSEQEIIITSAYSDTKYMIDAIRLGVNSYIIKPMNYEQMNLILYRTVNKIVNVRENMMYKIHLEELVEKRSAELLKLERDKVENFEKTLKALVNIIESRDTYTGGHSGRVANYSKLIAQQLDRSSEECELIYQAGILHDIGKISTPDSILLKPGKLNEFEYKLIKDHVSIGYELLSNIPMYNNISEIILYHHEHYDGSGYPKGLRGDKIPLLARIMMVADSFDAMTTNRIYKGRKTIPEAINELKELSGIQFHPEVAEAASIALKNVNIMDEISQHPISETEIERFSYFYKDQLTGVYNVAYLDYMLNHNAIVRTFKYLNVLYMHNFNQYNDRYSWSKGDELLHAFANYLINKYPEANIFRIHGDDFILLTETALDIDMNEFDNMEILVDSNISISKRHISLIETVIDNISTLKDWL